MLRNFNSHENDGSICFRLKMSTIFQLTGDGAKWIALLTYSRDDEGTAISCCGWDSAAAVRAENLGYFTLRFHCREFCNRRFAAAGCAAGSATIGESGCLFLLTGKTTTLIDTASVPAGSAR